MSRRKPIVTKNWWQANSSEVHTHVWNTVSHIRDLTANRRDAERLYWDLYTNHQTTGLESYRDMDANFNLIAQAIDTAAAQIVSPRTPLYTTSDADFTLQRTARKLTQATEGQLDDLKCNALMAQMFVDACVGGTGHLFGYLDPETNEPRIERCLPGSVLVDPRDGQREEPYCMYYRMPIARAVLEELYPNSKFIETASAPTMMDRKDLWLSHQSTVDDVMVVYAYRRPTTKKSKDGRMVVCTDKGTLVDEDWDSDLPFVPFRWKHRPGSYFGMGIAEAGLLPQARFIKHEKKNEALQDVLSQGWLVANKTDKVRITRSPDAPMGIIEYEGPPGTPAPQLQVFNGTPSDLIADQERIRERFLAELGISQQQATGAKPAGINSAVGQRTYQDIAATRQKPQQTGFADAYVALFKLLLQLNQQASKLSPDYKIKAKTTRGRQTLLSDIDWNEIELPENKYRVTCAPISAVSNDPSAKMELVTEWIASGLTSRTFAQNMLMESTLDTDSVSRLELADLDSILYDIERIEDGFQVMPDPYMDLKLASDVARRAYVHRRTQNVPEEVLAAMRLYVDQCIEGIKTSKMPPPEEAPVAPQQQ